MLYRKYNRIELVPDEPHILNIRYCSYKACVVSGCKITYKCKTLFGIFTKEEVVNVEDGFIVLLDYEHWDMTYEDSLWGTDSTTYGLKPMTFHQTEEEALAKLTQYQTERARR